MIARALLLLASVALIACGADREGLDGTKWSGQPPVNYLVFLTFDSGRYEEARTQVVDSGWAVVQRTRGAYSLVGDQITFAPDDVTCPPATPNAATFELRDGRLHLTSAADGLWILNAWNGKTIFSPPLVRTDLGCLPRP